MDSDSDIVRCSSFGFLLVADFYVIFNPYEMFIAIGPKTLGGGMIYLNYITYLLIRNIIISIYIMCTPLLYCRKRTRKTIEANMWPKSKLSIPLRCYRGKWVFLV